MWPYRKMVEREGTDSTSFACVEGEMNVCVAGYPASDHLLDLGDAPILWEVVKKGHLFSAPTPRYQSTGMCLRPGPLEALAWPSGS